MKFPYTLWETGH